MYIYPMSCYLCNCTPEILKLYFMTLKTTLLIVAMLTGLTLALSLSFYGICCSQPTRGQVSTYPKFVSLVKIPNSIQP